MSQNRSKRRGTLKRNYGLKHVRLILAGMGVGVSSWSLANEAARYRWVMPTVSGILAEHVVTRTLQRGDPGGHFRRALCTFPFPEIGRWIIEDYYVEGGIPAGKKFKPHPVFDLNPSRKLQQLMVASEFCLVWLAKAGHKGLVSVNYLEKVQITHIWYLLGAMLAGVDFVSMGAGIITQIPGVIDAIASGQHPHYKVDVSSFDGSNTKGGEATTAEITFDPEELLGGKLPPLKKPGLLAIVSGDFLARVLVKKCPGKIAGFIIEYPTAGGHNAPPRGRDKKFNDKGEPQYAEGVGEKDWVDLREFKKIGLPYWLAGSCCSPDVLKKARSAGAGGVQVGSAFALCQESGMLSDLRDSARSLGYRGELSVVRTLCSPTKYPFNVAQIKGTLSDSLVLAGRKRACNICALRVPFQKEGKIGGYRCPAESFANWSRKGGVLKDAESSVCLCSALLATIGLGNPGEPPIVTLGQTLDFLRHLMRHEKDTYTLADVIAYVLKKRYKKRR